VFVAISITATVPALVRQQAVVPGLTVRRGERPDGPGQITVLVAAL
jgi:hypothetical protein